jgi:ABC-type transport system involved in multi-copper enzyme maturation permease subunit
MISSLIAFSILGPPPSLPGPPTNATTPGQIQISEEYRNYIRKANEISSSINAWSINYHFTTVSNRLFQTITMGPSGQQQTREISILDALSSSAINIFIMIFFTALFIILSYISFTRKEER